MYVKLLENVQSNQYIQKSTHKLSNIVADKHLSNKNSAYCIQIALISSSWPVYVCHTYYSHWITNFISFLRNFDHRNNSRFSFNFRFATEAIVCNIYFIRFHLVWLLLCELKSLVHALLLLFFFFFCLCVIFVFIF